MLGGLELVRHDMGDCDMDWGKIGFPVSEYVVIRLLVIGFAKDNLPSVIEPRRLERGGGLNGDL